MNSSVPNRLKWYAADFDAQMELDEGIPVETLQMETLPVETLPMRSLPVYYLPMNSLPPRNDFNEMIAPEFQKWSRLKWGAHLMNFKRTLNELHLRPFVSDS